MFAVLKLKTILQQLCQESINWCKAI